MDLNITDVLEKLKTTLDKGIATVSIKSNEFVEVTKAKTQMSVLQEGRQMIKKYAALVLLLCLCTFGSIPVFAAAERGMAADEAAADFSGYMYERWQTEPSPTYLTCPLKDVHADEVVLYGLNLLDIVVKNQQKSGVSCFFTIQFDYDGPLPAIEGTNLVRYYDTEEWDLNINQIDGLDYYEDHIQVSLSPQGKMGEWLGLTDDYALAYEKLKKLAAQVPGDRYDVQQQLYHLADYLEKNTVYEPNPFDQSIVGTMIKGKAVCGGYAETVNTYCRILNIPCITIRSVPEGNHGWNAVYCEPKMVYEIGETKYPADWYEIDLVAPGNALLMPDDEKRIRLFKKMYDISEAVMYKTTQTMDTAFEEDKRYARYEANYQNGYQYVAKNQLFRGDADGDIRYSDGLSRNEFAVLAVKAAGADAEVQNRKAYYSKLCQFKDVEDWAKPYVGYAYENGWVNGYSSEIYGAGDLVGMKALSLVLLRSFGLDDAELSYENACAKAKELDLLPELRSADTDFPALRSDAAIMLYKYSLSET